MPLSHYEIERIKVYKKHYSMISLEILPPYWNGKYKTSGWIVYYMIRFMDDKRPLFMRIIRCKSKQAAVVKISEIEDYISENL